MSRGLWQRLCSWFAGDLAPPAEDVERLRASFKARYNAFRLLLAANQRALEAMTDIERALESARPIDLSYIRHRYTQVAAAVYNMVACLERIQPHEHRALVEQFRQAQNRIDAILDVPEPNPDSPLVLQLRGLTAADADLVGAKMALLGDLSTALGVPIPAGFVTTARAYHAVMTHSGLGYEIRRLIQVGGTDEPRKLAETSRRVRDLIAGTPLPEALELALIDGYRELRKEAGPDATLLMRSSALGEDTPGCSFAGIYESVFDVTGSTLIRAFKQVIASKYSPQAIHYRLHAGLRDDTEAMCVGCMPTVDAVAGGVTYSRNPLVPSGDEVIVHSAWGLPRTVVDGSDGVDVFVVSRADLSLKGSTIGRKRNRYVLSGVNRRCELEPTAGLASEASLTAEQATAAARLALEIERYRGEPQDIEWALARDGSIIVLQCRSLAMVREPSTRVPATAKRPADEVLLTGGVTASAGIGSGPVQLVRTERDARGFPSGAVLLAYQAVPEWALALDRAAAVVTEVGGVANHLASVAREFGVPALFGVPDATALEAGSPVTVDADSRTVYRGYVMGSGADTAPRGRRFTRGPIYQTLAEVAEHIVKLGLLDPENPEFDAHHCQSLHDITRYCHERAVQAMFRFGAEHRFPGGTARQLKCDVPMQYWIIDLNDGLRESARDSRYVQLEDLLSIPALALWRGMTALVWEGPPPVNPRGFMDVVLQSTATPGLDPAVPSRFSQRNYLMIARNFCSLQSRFGYHYATVEALVGERTMENYASLQFKAGGAGSDLRNRRVRLIAEVLTEKRFRTTVEGDLLRARTEGLDREPMEQQLVVLGHLLIHTRQLDMAMTDEAAIGRYKSEISKQLEQLSVKEP